MVVATLLLIIVGTPLALWTWVRMPQALGQYAPLEQPVQFDHRHHVGDDGIDCRFCHDTVDRSAYAGVPPTERCMSCHAQIWPESDLLAPVRASYFTGRPIAWRRVHDLPDHVFFDHSIHVRKGVGCVTCHGRVDEMGAVAQVAPLTMEWCLDCHRDPAPNLRPLEEVTSLEWRPPGDAAALGKELMARYAVRSQTHCSACHR